MSPTPASPPNDNFEAPVDATRQRLVPGNVGTGTGAGCVIEAVPPLRCPVGAEHIIFPRTRHPFTHACAPWLAKVASPKGPRLASVLRCSLASPLHHESAPCAARTVVVCQTKHGMHAFVHKCAVLVLLLSYNV